MAALPPVSAPCMTFVSSASSECQVLPADPSLDSTFSSSSSSCDSGSECATVIFGSLTAVSNGTPHGVNQLNIPPSSSFNERASTPHSLDSSYALVALPSPGDSFVVPSQSAVGLDAFCSSSIHSPNLSDDEDLAGTHSPNQIDSAFGSECLVPSADTAALFRFDRSVWSQLLKSNIWKESKRNRMLMESATEALVKEQQQNFRRISSSQSMSAHTQQSPRPSSFDLNDNDNDNNPAAAFFLTLSEELFPEGIAVDSDHSSSSTTSGFLVQSDSLTVIDIDSQYVQQRAQINHSKPKPSLTVSTFLDSISSSALLDRISSSHVLAFLCGCAAGIMINMLMQRQRYSASTSSSSSSPVTLLGGATAAATAATATPQTAGGISLTMTAGPNSGTKSVPSLFSQASASALEAAMSSPSLVKPLQPPPSVSPTVSALCSSLSSSLHTLTPPPPSATLLHHNPLPALSAASRSSSASAAAAAHSYSHSASSPLAYFSSSNTMYPLSLSALRPSPLLTPISIPAPSLFSGAAAHIPQSIAVLSSALAEFMRNVRHWQAQAQMQRTLSLSWQLQSPF